MDYSTAQSRLERKRHAILQAAAIIHAAGHYSMVETSVKQAEELYNEVLRRENKETTKT